MGRSGCWAWACGQRRGCKEGTRVPTLAPRGQGRARRPPDSLSSIGPDHSCHVVSWWLGISAALAQPSRRSG